MNALTAADRRGYEANIWKSYLFQFLSSFQLFWPIWVLYLTDYRKFTLTQVSGLEALFWLVVVITEVPTGAIADRFGRKTSLLASAACTTVAILVFGAASNYWIVLVSYIAWGFGLTFASGADSALLYESLKALGREHEYQRVAGINFGLFSAGALGGLLVGAPVAAATNLAFPILLGSGIMFVALLVVFTFKEPAIDHGEPRLDYRRLISESARTAWRLPSVRWMIICAGLLLATQNASFVFAQPFLDRHDVPVQLFGFVQAPMRAMGIFGSLLAVRATASFGFRGTLVGCAVLLVVSYALLGGWHSVYAFAGIGIITLSFSMTQPIVVDYLNKRIPSNQRATILSFRNLLTSIGIVALQPGLGVIADHVSLTAVFWTSAVVVAVFVPPVLYMWLRADAEESAARAPPEVEPAAAS